MRRPQGRVGREAIRERLEHARRFASTPIRTLCRGRDLDRVEVMMIGTGIVAYRLRGNERGILLVGVNSGETITIEAFRDATSAPTDFDSKALTLKR